MTMLDDRPAAVPTLEEAIAQLDSPEAVADRRRRATKRAKALEGLARGRVIFSAGIVELDRLLDRSAGTTGTPPRPRSAKPRSRPAMGSISLWPSSVKSTSTQRTFGTFTPIPADRQPSAPGMTTRGPSASLP